MQILNQSGPILEAPLSQLSIEALRCMLFRLYSGCARTAMSAMSGFIPELRMTAFVAVILRTDACVVLCSCCSFGAHPTVFLRPYSERILAFFRMHRGDLLDAALSSLPP